MVHGEKAAKEAEETARKTFEQGGVGGALPVVEIASARLKEGIEAYNLLFEAGLTASKSEARKLIRGGGGKVNNVKFADEAQKVTLADMQGDGIKLSAGSKRHVLVKAV
jgi:tyrosyl-tRNA synthetase